MKKLMKEYGFDHQERYFDMIWESYNNGQFKQTREQINALSKAKKKELYQYFVECNCDEKIKSIVLELI